MMVLVWPQFVAFVVLFFVGKINSLLIYQVCWSNGRAGQFNSLGALATLLRKPLPWLLHLPSLLLTSCVSWEDAPTLRLFSTITLGLLAMGAIGRFGAVDLRRFFVADRIIVALLTIGVYFHPVFIYPATVAACCLQYTISGWPLGPGYSNLLGFEFIRGTACVLTACIGCRELLITVGLQPDRFESLAFAVVLGYQASTYVNNALAKTLTGGHVLAWITQNRVQCLLVNAHLRGWGSGVFSTAFVLKLARLVGWFRIPFCATAFAIEAGFVFVLARVELCFAMLVSATGFHVMVFLMTGLLELEYVVNHVTLCVLIHDSSLALAFSSEHVIAFCLCAAICFTWVGWLRLRIFDAYQQSGAANPLHRLADAADLLMAWWDSPYMRMFTYTATTASGRELSWSVNQMSPYDTALTDIHTHIMLLRQHPGLDPQAESDRQIARTGVWGLVASIEERDRLYRLMDESKPDLNVLQTTVSSNAWRCDGPGDGPSDGPVAAQPLWRLFDCTNQYLRFRWFRMIMKWPHFPGEDMVPDVCPLVTPSLPPYHFNEPVVQVTLSRIKTFYTGSEIVLVEQSTVGTFHFDPRAAT